MVNKKPFLRIQIDLPAKDRLKRLCKRRGMSEIQVTTRLVDWFFKQDDHIQTLVLRQLSDESMAALARSRLKSIGKD